MYVLFIYVDDSSRSRLIKVPSNKPTLLTYHDNNKYLMNPCELSNLIGSPGIKYMADITNRTHSFIIWSSCAALVVIIIANVLGMVWARAGN